VKAALELEGLALSQIWGTYQPSPERLVVDPSTSCVRHGFTDCGNSLVSRLVPAEAEGGTRFKRLTRRWKRRSSTRIPLRG